MEHDGRFSYSHIYSYLASGSYPEGVSKYEKIVMSWRRSFFRVHQKDL